MGEGNGAGRELILSDLLQRCKANDTILTHIFQCFLVILCFHLSLTRPLNPLYYVARVSI